MISNTSKIDSSTNSTYSFHDINLTPEEEEAKEIIHSIFSQLHQSDKRKKIPDEVKTYIKNLVQEEERGNNIGILDNIKANIKEKYKISIGRSTLHLLLQNYRLERYIIKGK